MFLIEAGSLCTGRSICDLIARGISALLNIHGYDGAAVVIKAKNMHKWGDTMVSMIIETFRGSAQHIVAACNM